MKAILMSIKPKWCEMIFSGKKTIEVRKTAPKETPFKVYVYCTKERMTRVPSMYAYLHKNEPRACAEYGTIEKWGEIGDVIVNPHLASKHLSYGMHGKVVGEFVCDTFITDKTFGKDALFNGAACLTQEEAEKYSCGKVLYGLHITEPKLYDKPRELGWFRKPCEYASEHYACYPDNCARCPWNTVTRPPQSWCYVEELGR